MSQKVKEIMLLNLVVALFINVVFGVTLKEFMIYNYFIPLESKLSVSIICFMSVSGTLLLTVASACVINFICHIHRIREFNESENIFYFAVVGLMPIVPYIYISFVESPLKTVTIETLRHDYNIGLCIMILSIITLTMFYAIIMSDKIEKEKLAADKYFN